MTFDHAKNYRMPIGKYKGKSFDEISQTDEGLLYLDWMVAQSWVGHYMRTALAKFLSDPSIQKELNEVMESRR